MPELLATNIH